MKIKNIFFVVFLFFALKSTSNAQSEHTPRLGINIGNFVSASPDSIFLAKADVFIGDSIQVSAVHLMVKDSSNTNFDNQYTFSTISESSSENPYKNNYHIYIDVPNYNPYKLKHYILELLSANGQLLLQIENDF